MSASLSRVTSSLAAMLSGTVRRADDGAHMETIRGAMLMALTPTSIKEQEATRRVRAHVQRASEVMTLWYLRADLLGAIAQADCENAARKTLDGITPLFHGHVPRPLLRRPSTLGR